MAEASLMMSKMQVGEVDFDTLFGPFCKEQSLEAKLPVSVISVWRPQTVPEITAEGKKKNKKQKTKTKHTHKVTKQNKTKQIPQHFSKGPVAGKNGRLFRGSTPGGGGVCVTVNTQLI